MEVSTRRWPPASPFNLAAESDPSAASREQRRAVPDGQRIGDVPASVRDDVLLLLTELVTNAVRHAGVGLLPSG